MAVRRDFYYEQGEEGSGYVTENYIQGIARQVRGLDLSRWANARNNTALASQLSVDAQAANTAIARLSGMAPGGWSQPTSLSQKWTLVDTTPTLQHR